MRPCPNGPSSSSPKKVTLLLNSATMCDGTQWKLISQLQKKSPIIIAGFILSPYSVFAFPTVYVCISMREKSCCFNFFSPKVFKKDRKQIWRDYKDICSQWMFMKLSFILAGIFNYIWLSCPFNNKKKTESRNKAFFSLCSTDKYFSP